VELVKKLHDSGAVVAEVPVHHYHASSCPTWTAGTSHGAKTLAATIA
jgi:hypothetical protein